MSTEWNPYSYEKESSSAVQPVKKVETFKAASEEGILIKFTVKKDTEITKDGDKSIQDEMDVLMGVPYAAFEKGKKL